jgi:hypothetical protein
MIRVEILISKTYTVNTQKLAHGLISKIFTDLDFE